MTHLKVLFHLIALLLKRNPVFNFQISVFYSAILGIYVKLFCGIFMKILSSTWRYNNDIEYDHESDILFLSFTITINVFYRPSISIKTIYRIVLISSIPKLLISELILRKGDLKYYGDAIWRISFKRVLSFLLRRW